MEVIVNFGGFYGTEHGAALDNIIESPYQDDEGKIPSDFYETSVIDYTAAKKDYCKAFIDFINEALDIKLKFKELISPREYNFGNDRIAAEITQRDYRKIVKFTKQHYAEELEANDSLLCQTCFDVLLDNDINETEWSSYYDKHCIYELEYRNEYVKYEAIK